MAAMTNVSCGSDSAVRFGRAARQLHPHQQTFATTLKSPLRADAGKLFGKNRGWAAGDRDGATAMAMARVM